MGRSGLLDANYSWREVAREELVEIKDGRQQRGFPALSVTLRCSPSLSAFTRFRSAFGHSLGTALFPVALKSRRGWA